MKERELRRRCRRLLNDLDISPPLDVVQLCERLGVSRARPIRLMPYPLEVPGPFGCWIATGSADYIFFQQETTKAHQDHIILHELGHLLAEHEPGGDAEPADFLRGPATGLEDDAVHRALRRTSYDEAHEWEAETVATIILEWASVLNYTIPRRAADHDLRRIQGVLGDHQGWL
ncbi:hypothetical protein [Amycolatopsis saalfeldensis]|uniref:IrrE N-terminal-like domain-containing protein n=1 Tax=Amycolatopsis saalfeldensis TaxID=394193 RepID=A0A1H8YI76_9PSEU|nr:hypothetical protein [Amycolatopsis saalfeldensis]SEP51869.1 hypothetical protein SAMN04489732_117187 [Amycolatopsis saalfeldensis]